MSNQRFNQFNLVNQVNHVIYNHANLLLKIVEFPHQVVMTIVPSQKNHQMHQVIQVQNKEFNLVKKFK